MLLHFRDPKPPMLKLALHQLRLQTHCAPSTAHSFVSVTPAPNQQRTVLKANLWTASVSEIPSFHLLSLRHTVPLKITSSTSVICDEELILYLVIRQLIASSLEEGFHKFLSSSAVLKMRCLLLLHYSINSF